MFGCLTQNYAKTIVSICQQDIRDVATKNLGFVVRASRLCSGLLTRGTPRPGSLGD